MVTRAFFVGTAWQMAMFLPFGLRQGAGYFMDEYGGSEELMDLPLVFIAQPDGFRRERVGNDPADRAEKR
jgi:hypothetical protein